MTRFSGKKLVAGNWKMNGKEEEFTALLDGLRERAPKHDVWVFTPATLISRFSALAQGAVWVGGQDCHHQESGAYTGDISASLLCAAGARAVIVGHSERRRDHGETDALLKTKAQTARKAGLQVILCVGEKPGENGKEVVARQLNNFSGDFGDMLVAYEPIWAIGTGKIPSLRDIRAMHMHIRSVTSPTARILYGGSVTPKNSAAILGLAEVDGVLVGGASLKAKDFLSIIYSP